MSRLITMLMVMFSMTYQLDASASITPVNDQRACVVQAEDGDNTATDGEKETEEEAEPECD